MQGILVVGHGSKSSHAVEVLSRVGKALSASYDRVSIASMQFNAPNIEEATADLVSQGVTDIIVAPFFLYQGNHILMDIPEELEELNRKHPELTFRLADSLGYDDRLVGMMRERIDAAMLSGNGNGRTPSDIAPGQIEARSMEIIRELMAEVPYDGLDFEIVQRIVHTTGDPGIAADVVVEVNAAQAGLAALRSGASIITDVTMVQAGLHRNKLAALGCEVLCLIEDEGIAERAAEAGMTRSATAMRALLERMDGSIICIGNAPTALFEVVEMIRSEGVRPALVIGTPVGFVDAREAKEALIEASTIPGERSIPYVTIRGHRGGSPIAAASLNALLQHC